MSESVLAGPEFGFYRILRPFAGFEAVYEGEPVNKPIMMTEAGDARDDNASLGIDGYDPDLVRGLAVPMGARVVLLLPNIGWGTLPVYPYEWRIMWRVRNTFDHRVSRGERLPYHLPKQGQGVPDTTGPNPGPRVVIPAFWQSLVYNQAEPLVDWSHGVANVRAEIIRPGAAPGTNPLLPDGAVGALQQGVLPSTHASYTLPTFTAHEVQALGDEMLLAIVRPNTPVGEWEFASTDSDLSEYMGAGGDGPYPDIGVMVSMGVSP